jgi:hypothetical protein
VTPGQKLMAEAKAAYEKWLAEHLDHARLLNAFTPEQVYGFGYTDGLRVGIERATEMFNAKREAK